MRTDLRVRYTGRFIAVAGATVVIAGLATIGFIVTLIGLAIDAWSRTLV